ncbi:MAG: family transcriptional regulator, cyclic receptor protein [Acetobacteraceae bacterium]|nr:family transcriptional regulator, cyclic receptor protein [Acetobacteraceae bacterium]
MANAPLNREEILAGHFLLRYLRQEELSRIAGSAVLVRHKAQATIFQRGDPGASMMAVVSGRVKICTFSADGKELVLNIIDRGSLFGEIALLDGQPRSADAVALDDTELLVLDRNRLMPILTANPETAARMITVLCQRLRQTSEALEDALLRDAPSRVARGLLRLARTFGKPEAGGTRLDIKLSQQQMGSLIGISRESINRYIVEWSRAGYLAVNGGFVTILDLEALEAVSEAEL